MGKDYRPHFRDAALYIQRVCRHSDYFNETASIHPDFKLFMRLLLEEAHYTITHPEISQWYPRATPLLARADDEESDGPFSKNYARQELLFRYYALFMKNPTETAEQLYDKIRESGREVRSGRAKVISINQANVRRLVTGKWVQRASNFMQAFSISFDLMDKGSPDYLEAIKTSANIPEREQVAQMADKIESYIKQYTLE